MGALAAGALAVATLAGCAETVWTKPGVGTSERDAALAECEDYADREQEEDFVSRIEDTQRGVTTGDDDESVLRMDFRRHDERNRRSSLIASCMRGLGYIATEVTDPEDAGTEDPGAEDPGAEDTGTEDTGGPADAS